MITIASDCFLSITSMLLIYPCIHGFMMVQSNTRRIMTMINDSCQHRCGTTFTNKRSMFFFFRMKTPRLMVRKDIIGHERQTADCTLSICSD